MNHLFSEFFNLNEIKGINKFNTNQVTNIETMFQLCSEFQYLDLSNFDTSKITDLSFIFSLCYNLKEIKGKNKFNTNQVNNMRK